VVRGRGKVDNAPVADGPIVEPERWGFYAARAEQFVSSLPVPRTCVVLTVVPYPATKSAEAKAIADALGLELTIPKLDDLRTFDGSHLDRPSAERWSKAFFDLAGPRIQQCLTTAAPGLAIE
jgi:hypothetical protein